MTYEEALQKEIKEEWDALKVPCSGEYGDDTNVEKIKEKSWDLLRRSLKLGNERGAAYFLLHGVITCHYWRARRCIECMKNENALLRRIRGKKYCEGYQLDIDHYTRHWLWANGDRKELFPYKLVELIKDGWGYEAEECKYLPKNASIYQGEGF